MSDEEKLPPHYSIIIGVVWIFIGIVSLLGVCSERPPTPGWVILLILLLMIIGGVWIYIGISQYLKNKNS